MIPSAILAGLIVGSLVIHRSHLAPLMLIGAMVALAWGALVAVAVDRDAFVGGAALAFPNFMTGALFAVAGGWVLRHLGQAFRRAGAHRARAADA